MRKGLIPGRVGMVAGLFFGLAFGIAGIGAAVLGWLADRDLDRSSSITSAPSSRRSACSRPFCPRRQSQKLPESEESADGKPAVLAPFAKMTPRALADFVFFVQARSWQRLRRWCLDP